MATNTKERTLKNKNRSRPKKGAAEKRRRLRTQRRRLVGLGVPEAVAETMTAIAVRTMLRRPARIKPS